MRRTMLELHKKPSSIPPTHRKPRAVEVGRDEQWRPRTTSGRLRLESQRNEKPLVRTCFSLTRAISGSRPSTFHQDRFYRESAALRCSARPTTRGSLRRNSGSRDLRTERILLMASTACGTHIGSDAITRPQARKGNNKTTNAPEFRRPDLAAKNANPTPPTTIPYRNAEINAHGFHARTLGIVMMSTFSICRTAKLISGGPTILNPAGFYPPSDPARGYPLPLRQSML